MERTATATFSTPWGDGTVVVDGGRLIEVRLPDPGTGVAGAGSAERATASVIAAPPKTAVGVEPGTGSPAFPPAGGDVALARAWAERIDAYFATGVPQWSADDVDLAAVAGTPFRRAVYATLLRVPAGETVSYGELAAMAGRPGAARAVGSAMAQNPICLVVPCHRVVRGDGSLGHFGDCDAWKAHLLALESPGNAQSSGGAGQGEPPVDPAWKETAR